MLKDITTIVEEYVLSFGVYAPILACLLIMVESILPFLPLFVFITVNFIAFGTLVGFILSWIFTCLGCFLSYFLFRQGLGRYNIKDPKNINLFNKSMRYIHDLSLPSLTVIIAIPFTPAFMMNIAAGISKMEFKKFATAITIGKLFMVYFWGFVGLGIVESFKNPIALVKVGIMVLIAFIISKVVNNYYNK